MWRGGPLCEKVTAHFTLYLEKQKGGWGVEKVERDKKKRTQKAHWCMATGFRGEIFPLRRLNRTAGRV